MKKLKLISTGLIICIALLIITGCLPWLSLSSQSNSSVNIQQVQSNPSQMAYSNLLNLSAMLDTVEHSVMQVNVTSVAVDPLGQATQSVDAGTAWVIDPSGVLVTCEHVVDGAIDISVTTIDGASYPAQIINSDKIADISILKVDQGTLPALKVADTSRLRVGTWVLTVGNPLGQGISAKQGIISRLGINMPYNGEQLYKNMIEVSAAINAGNSGGPLVDLEGNVIGINSLKVSEVGVEGMGYAINMADAVPIIKKLTTK